MRIAVYYYRTMAHSDMTTKRNTGPSPTDVALLVGFLVAACRLQLKDAAAACGVHRGNLSSFLHSMGSQRNVSMAKLADLTFHVFRCHSNGVLGAGLHCWVLADSKWLSGGLRAVLAANVASVAAGGGIEFVRSGVGPSSTGTLGIQPSDLVMVLARVEPDAVETVEKIVRDLMEERARHGLNGVAIRPADASDGVRMRDAWMSVRDFGAHESNRDVLPVLTVVDDIRRRDQRAADKQVSPVPIS